MKTVLTGALAVALGIVVYKLVLQDAVSGLNLFGSPKAEQ